METSLLISASFGTFLLIAVVIVAAVLLSRWRREMRARGGRRNRVTLEALFAEWTARRGGADAADPAGEAAASGAGVAALAQLADAEGLLTRLRQEGEAGGQGGEELSRTIVEAELEIQTIRACLNRGETARAHELAKSLTLRLAARITRLGPPVGDRRSHG